jgi:hypothetical protein
VVFGLSGYLKAVGADLEDLTLSYNFGTLVDDPEKEKT